MSMSFSLLIFLFFVAHVAVHFTGKTMEEVEVHLSEKHAESERVLAGHLARFLPLVTGIAVTQLFQFFFLCPFPRSKSLVDRTKRACGALL